MRCYLCGLFILLLLLMPFSASAQGGSSGVINVTAAPYNAACDGSTNDLPAINSAIAAAAALPSGGQVYFPSMCRVDSSTGSVQAMSHVTLMGPGRGRGGLVIDDSVSPSNNGIVYTQTSSLVDFHIRSMTISGMRASIAKIGVQLVDLDLSVHGPHGAVGGDDLSVEDSDLVESRYMGMAILNAKHVIVRGNRVYHTNADGIAVWDSSDVLITNNIIEGANDDAISAHSQDATSAPVRSGITITDNIITESQGIDVLGAKNVTIARNVLHRIMAYGIVAMTDPIFGQGDTSVFGVHISDNTIVDVFLRPEPSPRNQEQYYIRVGGGPRVPGAGNSSAPGVPSSPSGVVPSLFGPDGVGNFYTNGQITGGSVPGPGGYWVDVTGNRLLRTLPAPVAAYSDWGYNPSLFTGDNGGPTGVYDGPIAEDHLNISGIEIEPSLRNSRIENNTVQTTGPYSIYVDLNATVANGDFDGLLIAGNKLADFQSAGIWFNIGNAAERILVRDNEVDGDPRFVSSKRGASGTWTASANIPLAFYLTMSGGVLTGNTVRNVSQVLVGGTNVAKANIIYANPAAVGQSTSNAGVGTLPADGPDFSYVIEDSNPASSTYGQMLSSQLTSGTAPPASGTYVAGHFVSNSTAATILPQVGFTLTGWLRLTTGTSNIVGVDWQPIYTQSGSYNTMQLTLTPNSGTLGTGASASLTYTKSGPLTVLYQLSVSIPNLGSVPAGSPVAVGTLPFQAQGPCTLVGRESAVTGKLVDLPIGNGAQSGTMLNFDNSPATVAGMIVTLIGTCPTSG